MKDLNKIGFEGGIIYSAFSEPFLYNHLEEVIKISKKQCPKSRIELVTNGDFLTIDKLNEPSLGALMMHYMLETVMIARLLDINPFNQPAVEDGKLRAQEYLKS